MEDEHYYEELLAIPWEEHFDVNTTFAVDVVGRNELLNHSSFAGLKAKDAIVDRFRDKVGDRPTVERGTPEVPIHIHLSGYHSCVSRCLRRFITQTRLPSGGTCAIK